MPISLRKTIYTGTFISCPSLNNIQIDEHLAVGVDEDGIIRHLSDLLAGGKQQDSNVEDSVKTAAVTWGWGEERWDWVRGGTEGDSWWFPGFVGKSLVLCLI